MRSFVLSSGSSANCFYVEDNNIKILIDCGLSFSKTKEFLNKKCIKIKDINSVFITHEHSDHIAGFEVIFKNLSCNFYLTKGTFDFLEKKFDFLKNEENKNRFVFIKNHDLIKLDDLSVFVIEKSHDANEPVNFVISNGDKKYGFFTDLGYIGDEIRRLMGELDVLFIETNYCDKILDEKKELLYSNYINRLKSDVGHLSVMQACEVIEKVANDNMKIVLCHISENTNKYANSYLNVKKSLSKCNLKSKLLVSFQKKPTDWIE